MPHAGAVDYFLWNCAINGDIAILATRFDAHWTFIALIAYNQHTELLLLYSSLDH